MKGSKPLEPRLLLRWPSPPRSPDSPPPATSISALAQVQEQLDPPTSHAPHVAVAAVKHPQLLPPPSAPPWLRLGLSGFTIPNQPSLNTTAPKKKRKMKSQPLD
ncbi:hypothetical protein VNO77_42222 [Canavalia gladiata]|uniref:Uncharacterized protein n=1 Tax=Canavalia gladiata TaxID=3824 RepID=A0AAN9K183_CANGL